MAVSPEVRSDLNEIAITVHALEIILTSPGWPARNDCPESAFPLYDVMLEGSKPFARAIAEGRFSDALLFLCGLVPMVNHLLDECRIDDTPSAQKLLAVFCHYMESCEVDWSKLNPPHHRGLPKSVRSQ